MKLAEVKSILEINGYEVEERTVNKNGLEVAALSVGSGKIRPSIYAKTIEQMEDEDTTIVALLHDVVEDTNYTISDLNNMGFPQQVMDAIAVMTHDASVPYLDYVAKLKENAIARTVKLADLRHNSDITRLDTVDQKALDRVAKYAQAIRLLEG